MVDRIRALLPAFQASLPAGVELNTEIDRTLTIRESVASAQTNMLISIGLVILVVFAFLRSGWATVIPSISVPVSLITTFGVMYLCRYSLDNLSLMALAIATGFVVDDAIVVIENISRHIENGMKPMNAALRGASEIGFTVLSMSISLIAVFIPILLMPGIVGRLFREFAVVLSTAITVSLLVSLTTTPMMCSRLLKAKHEHGSLYNATERFYQWILSTYGAALDTVLRNSAPMLVVILLTIGSSVYLYIKIPKGFFPQQDTGFIAGTIVGQQHISYQALVEKSKWFEKIIRTDPDVEKIDLQAGGNTSGVAGGNTASVWFLLKPIGVRKDSADQVIARLRSRTASMPGAVLLMTTQQDVSIGARQAYTQFQYTLQAPDFPTLATWGPRVLRQLSTLPEIIDVASDQQVSGLSSNIIVDRDTASRLGLTAQAVDSALYDAFGQRQVSTMYKSINQYHVVLVLQQQWWTNPDFLNTIYIQTPRGTDVPLSAFAHFTQGVTPLSLPHQGQFPATTISFNLQQGYSLSDAVTAINRSELDMGLPADVTGNFAGTAQAFQTSLSSQPILILIAIATVYIVLGILYESLIHPLTIIGIILLIGIVIKNAIMMIDFALAAERNDGLNSRDAIYQACILRFRPIMMTTSCALLGGLPLALGHAAGSELRRPLGITIVGGLIVSQMLTLFTTPVVYITFDRLRRLAERRKERQGPADFAEDMYAADRSRAAAGD